MGVHSQCAGCSKSKVNKNSRLLCDPLTFPMEIVFNLYAVELGPGGLKRPETQAEDGVCGPANPRAKWLDQNTRSEIAASAGPLP
jgi:hypothetical protein